MNVSPSPSQSEETVNLNSDQSEWGAGPTPSGIKPEQIACSMCLLSPCVFAPFCRSKYHLAKGTHLISVLNCDPSGSPVLFWQSGGLSGIIPSRKVGRKASSPEGDMSLYLIAVAPGHEVTSTPRLEIYSGPEFSWNSRDKGPGKHCSNQVTPCMDSKVRKSTG
jgi:hypothetical protein